ncbi:CRISP/Allergen/PR-1-like [Dermacentor silvarum]|uniref:CRISP/Allergen/PR-1-like n=1 Tax=Dermacentor silvarum TaxID=543639 RepID=UPI00210157FB|nr:CRISP/Allergen/PR-1-like [Dermacentor silvarum]
MDRAPTVCRGRAQKFLAIFIKEILDHEDHGLKAPLRPTSEASFPVWKQQRHCQGTGDTRRSHEQAEEDAMGRCLRERLLLLLVAATHKPHNVSAKRAGERRSDLAVSWLHPPAEFVVPCTVRERGFDGDQQAAVVKAHNEYRSLVAKGELPDFEPAADMCETTWDPDLAEVAQSYVEQCAPQKEVLQARDFIEQGQNLCLQTLPGTANDTGFEACVAAWFSEHAGCSKRIIESYRNTSGRDEASCEHFTQLVWSRSQYVGCGFALVESSDGVTRNLYACNYDEPGNHPGTAVYVPGPACSSCPRYTTCVAELGLCRADHLTPDKPAEDTGPTKGPKSGHGDVTISSRQSLTLMVSSSVLAFLVGSAVLP